MTTAPRTPPRVPRSRIDAGFAPATLLPPIRIASGMVVSIDTDETCTVLVGDDEISGVVFLNNPPDVDDLVELEIRGDLFVIRTAEGTPETDGINDDASHIVDVDDPGAPPPSDVNIGGSMRDEAAWYFLPPDTTVWSREADPDGVGLRVWQSAGSAPGTLWSDLPFEVEPGDVLALTVETYLLGGTPGTVQVELCLDADEAGTALPGGDVQVVTLGPPVTVNAELVPITVTYTVPVEITAATSGNTPPRRARLGFALTGNGTANLALGNAALVQTPESWPVGSIWFDPDAEVGGLPTAAGQAENTIDTVGVQLPATVAFARAPGWKKVLVTAPPDTGGILFLIGTGAVLGASQGIGLDIGFTAGSAGGIWGFVRYTNPTTGVSGEVVLQGTLALAPGQEAEIYVRYKYSAAPGANLYTMRTTHISAIFIPGGSRAGGGSDPMVRYFDGDSWRPSFLNTAALDLTQDSTVTPPAKTATATAATRAPGSGLVDGDKITLTATVTPAAALGTVTFYRGSSASGPWNSIGSVSLPAGSNKVTKQWVSSPGTWYFLAKYLGNATYQSSQGVSASVFVAKKSGGGGGGSDTPTTKTLNVDAAFVQAYAGDGPQISGSGRDNAVHQGYFSGTYGNRRSILRFNTASLPADAEITKVELICQSGGWDHWYQNSGGTLIVGWHENDTAPSNWSNVTKHVDQSRHGVNTGGWSVNLTGWAKDVVKRAAFKGLTIGPGPSNSTTYYGYSDTPGASWFRLSITYKTFT